MADETVKMLLIGAGVHASAVLHTSLSLMENVDVIGCCDLDEKRAKKTANRFGLQTYYTNLDQMLSSEEADAAMVVAPPSVQSKIIKACLLSGLNVFVEKPFSITLEDATEITELATQRGLKVGIDFNKRFSPSYQKMKEISGRKGFGQISLFYSKFFGGYRPITQDLLRVGAIHMLDLSNYIVGRIQMVNAYMYEKKEGQVSIVVNSQFKNGSVGMFLFGSLGLWTAKGAEYVEIRGDRNYVIVENCREVTWQKPAPFKEGESSNQILQEEPTAAEYFEPNYSNVSGLDNQSYYQNGYYQAVESFVNSLLIDKQPSPSINEGIYALKLAIAIEQSIKEKKPIEIITN